MNYTEARIIREAATGYVRRLNRMTRAGLATLEANELAERGMRRVAGGPQRREEFISALMELRYPAAKMNEATHVLYHADGRTGSSACGLCHGHDGTHAGHLCECDRADETICTRCGLRACFHFSTTPQPGQRPILINTQTHDYAGAMANG